MLGAIVYNVLEWTWNTENIGSKELNDNPFYTKFNESNVRRQRRRLVRNFVQEVGLRLCWEGRGHYRDRPEWEVFQEEEAMG